LTHPIISLATYLLTNKLLLTLRVIIITLRGSNSLNGYCRPICLVFGTAALCDALVRSAVYKSSYLFTYLLSVGL